VVQDKFVHAMKLITRSLSFRSCCWWRCMDAND